MDNHTSSTMPGTFVSVLAVLGRLIAGGLFIYAAAVKLLDVQAFGLSIRSFDFLPDHLILLTAYVVPWTEALVGAALLLGVWTRSAALVYSGVLISFMVLIWATLERGMQIECGCFGKFELFCGTGISDCNLVQNGVLLAFGLIPLALGAGRWSVDWLRDANRTLDRGHDAP